MKLDFEYDLDITTSSSHGEDEDVVSHSRSDADSSVAMDDFLAARVAAKMTSDDDRSDRSSTYGDESPSEVADEETVPSLTRTDEDSPAVPVDDEESHRPQVDESAHVTPKQNSPPNSSPHSSHSSIPLTPTPIYNPFSNYTPSRTPRTEVMGVSLFSYAKKPQLRRPYQFETLQTDQDLEEYARRIRAELRYTEMFEVAREAERAAEAGQESFAARPSTYGDDSDDDVQLPLESRSLTPPPGCCGDRPEPLLTPSISQATQLNIPMRRTPGNRLGLLKLRDVQEVFPSFSLLHTHLRTHFARDKVDRKTLVFREAKTQPPNVSVDFPLDLSSSSRGSPLTRRRDSSRMDFFRWVRQGGKSFNEGLQHTTTKLEKAHSDVGELLSGHIHSAPLDNIERPRVDVPPGLEVADVAGVPQEPIKKPGEVKRSRGSLQTAETDAISFSSSDIDEAKAKSTAVARESVAPRALFDDENDSDSESVGAEEWLMLQVNGLEMPATPKDVLKKQESSGPDFVTPARLRDIKQVKKGGTGIAPRKDSLILPSNSVIESPSPGKSPLTQALKQPVLGIDDAIRESNSRDSSTFLLPMQYSRDSEYESGISYRSEETSASRQGTSDALLVTSPPMPVEKGVALPLVDVPSTGSAEGPKDTRCDPSLLGSTTPNPTEDSQTEQALSRPDDGVPVLPELRSTVRGDLNLKQRSRHVKVSVYGSPSNIGFAGGNERKRILQHSLLLPLQSDNPELKEADSLRTGDHDCACLISPASSLNSTDSFANGLSASRRSSQCTYVGSRRQSEGDSTHRRQNHSFSGALDLFSRLSPRKSMFSSKKLLYVRSRENDEFMNNYLYCSKPRDEEDAKGDGLCSEPCQDGDDFAPLFCCNPLHFGESALDFGPRKAVSTRSFVSVGGPSSDTKPEAETWFDMATERFDSVLDKLTKSVHRHADNQWTNITFQAPSLKKCHSQQKSLKAIAEKKSEDELDAYVPRQKTYSRRATLPPDLQKSVRNMDRGKKFQLFYDMLRDHISNLSSAATSSDEVTLLSQTGRELKTTTSETGEYKKRTKSKNSEKSSQGHNHNTTAFTKKTSPRV